MKNNVKPNVYAKVCPSRQVLVLIGEKWTCLVVGSLAKEGVLRFGQLKKSCEGVSQKMLTQTLRNLERDGLVKRTVFAEQLPIRVDYELTKLGLSLVPVVYEVTSWAEKNILTIEKNRLKYTQSLAPGETGN